MSSVNLHLVRKRISNILVINKKFASVFVIIVFVCFFFTPLIIRADSYSPGGDAMFNAWTISRNQNCILGDSCQKYSDANIYYPNKNTMLYSEAQLSPSIVTLPLRLITDNPILIYNFITIISVCFSAIAMYLLAKKISGNNEAVSILSGLFFAFAPFKIGAIWHLQNLSIFCLPLAILFIINYIEDKKRKNLLWIFMALLYSFFASWVQMVIILMGTLTFLIVFYICKKELRKQIRSVFIVVALSVICTIPLALQYVNFSKQNNAKFPLSDQVLYSSSVADYFIPHEGTVVGTIYYLIRKNAQVNSFNLDGSSYYGLSLFLAGFIVVFISLLSKRSFSKNKVDKTLVLSLVCIALLGLIFSLGPYLKLKAGYSYSFSGFSNIKIHMPYYLVDVMFPQLAFVRAVGRYGALLLFAICSLFALLPKALDLKGLDAFKRRTFIALISAFAVIELMPVGQLPMSKLKENYGLKTPTVYEYIKKEKSINDIVILRGDDDYVGAQLPVARAEDVLWSGYHNRNIFNGYSGYEPKNFMLQYINFINYNKNTKAYLAKEKLKYIIVDKKLSGPKSKKPKLLEDISKDNIKIFEDSRYVLFKIKY